MDIRDENFRFHVLAEVPMIIDDLGNTLASNEKLMNMPLHKIEDIASVLEGEVVYPILRATYTLPETVFCVYRKCTRPAVRGTLRCEDHPKKPDIKFN